MIGRHAVLVTMMLLARLSGLEPEKLASIKTYLTLEYVFYTII